MTVNTVIEENKAIITPVGRLNSSTASILSEEVEKAVASASEIILDLEKLEYMSSAGLRILLTAQKAMIKKQGSMTIKNVNEMIMEILELTGFINILNIEK